LFKNGGEGKSFFKFVASKNKKNNSGVQKFNIYYHERPVSMGRVFSG
jgi:hypothetical protein